MMDISMILDPWPWCMYAVIHDSYIYMILDPDACVYDAGMNDAYIHDLWPWCMYLWCGIFSGPTDGPTNKAILGVGCMRLGEPYQMTSFLSKIGAFDKAISHINNQYINTFQKYWWKDFERIPIPIKFCIDFIISNITNATVVPPWLLNFLSVLQNFSLLHCWVIQKAE